MPFRIKQVASHALPLAILSFCLVTLKVSLRCFDGPSESRVGFPLGWIKPSIVSSLEYGVDLTALAIDFCVYLGAWVWLSHTGFFKKVFGWRARLLSTSLWTMAAVVAGLYLLLLSHTAHLAGVTFDPRVDCTEFISYRLHIGPP